MRPFADAVYSAYAAQRVPQSHGLSGLHLPARRLSRVEDGLRKSPAYCVLRDAIQYEVMWTLLGWQEAVSRGLFLLAELNWPLF